jgi:hypothetical protein
MDLPMTSKMGILLREQFPDTGQLLVDYGAVLDTANLKEVVPKDYLINQGDVLSMPGSVVHGAPSYHEFRAVLFFVAHEKGKEKDAYNNEHQYFAANLLIDMAVTLWSELAPVPDERKALLLKLLQLAQQYKDLYKHVDATKSELYKWLRDIGNSKTKTSDSVTIRSITNMIGKDQI